MKNTLTATDLPILSDLFKAFSFVGFSNDGEELLATTEINLPCLGDVTISYLARSNDLMIYLGTQNEKGATIVSGLHPEKAVLGTYNTLLAFVCRNIIDAITNALAE